MPVAVCSWYLSMSMCRLVLKKSSLAVSLWHMDTISFFCLDSEELCLSRLMLENKHQGDRRVNTGAREPAPVGSRRVGAFSLSVLHGGLLSLLQPLPVLLQGADGVPRLAAGPPQWAVGQHALRVRFFWNRRRAEGGEERKRRSFP